MDGETRWRRSKWRLITNRRKWRRRRRAERQHRRKLRSCWLVMTKFMLRRLVGETSQGSVDHRSILAGSPVSLVHDDTHLVRVSTFGGSRGDTSITDVLQGLHSWT